jgi:nonsense-mediated mRNA decay protein 3
MSTIQLSSLPSQTDSIGEILCPDCGNLTPGSSPICTSCLRSSIDISSSIPKSLSLSFCRNCSRYLSPPNSWILAQLESRELLGICLRRIKSLNGGGGGRGEGIRLIDANWIWTEPHSRRLKVKVTIQKEVVNGTVLQQTVVIEYTISNTQCLDCARLASKQTWSSLIQVRQKVDHKRTFLFLEQLILKSGADKDTIGVKEVKDGLDFSYASKQSAMKMVEFLLNSVPAK